jgi:hypothetical protein
VREAILLVLIFGSCSALACVAMPPKFMRDHATLVDDATAIALIQAVAQGEGCELQVSRVLKGTKADFLNVDCRTPQIGDETTDFSNHQEDTFWKYRAGRISIYSDCNIRPPSFAVGKTYLAILGIEPDSKQFEQIGDADDRWLEFVESRINRKPWWKFW